MRLVLALPAGAELRELDAERSLVVLAGPAEAPAATLTLLHPRVAKMALIEFATDTTRIDLPPGTGSDVQSASVDHNRLGWEMQVVHTVVSRPGAPGPVEMRLSAIYRFVSHQPFVAAAVARILDPARFEELRPQILQIFDGGRPDWSSPEPACLAEIFE